MGRKTRSDRLANVVAAIRRNDGRIRANDIAKELNLHPQAVSRLLAATETTGDERLYEDDWGFLGIFKK